MASSGGRDQKLLEQRGQAGSNCRVNRRKSGQLRQKYSSPENNEHQSKANLFCNYFPRHKKKTFSGQTWFISILGFFQGLYCLKPKWYSKSRETHMWSVKPQDILWFSSRSSWAAECCWLAQKCLVSQTREELETILCSALCFDLLFGWGWHTSGFLMITITGVEITDKDVDYWLLGKSH